MLRVVVWGKGGGVWEIFYTSIQDRLLETYPFQCTIIPNAISPQEYPQPEFIRTRFSISVV